MYRYYTDNYKHLGNKKTIIYTNKLINNMYYNCGYHDIENVYKYLKFDTACEIPKWFKAVFVET